MNRSQGYFQMWLYKEINNSDTNCALGGGGASWSWSYGSWICKFYLCNQYLSPL